MSLVPEEYQDLLDPETKAFAFLATLMPDGSPHLVPLWFNTDGEHILINTAKGRVKDKNIRNRPDVAVVLMNTDQPYRYVQIRGKVVEIVEGNEEGDEAVEHTHTLSRIYTGQPFDIPEGQTRVMYKIKPNK